MSQPLPLQNMITQSSQADTTYRVLEVKYGNGYSQRAADGINNITSSWSVEWGVLTRSELDALVSALDLAAGVDYFTWAAPGDQASKKWIVKQHSRRVADGDLYSVTAKLEQVFDL